MDNDYELRYLPLFYEDMFEKVSYIRKVITTSELVDRRTRDRGSTTNGLN